MVVLKRDRMPDGTSIQLEEWNSYAMQVFKNEKVITCYPVMEFKPEAVMFGEIGKTFRVEINAEESEVDDIYNKLVSGQAAILDYKNQFYNSWCVDCL